MKSFVFSGTRKFAQSPRASRTILTAALAVVGLTATNAVADEIIFKNGDRLTGTIISASGGKLKFKSASAGEIQIDLSTVETFSTDAPLELHLSDGTVLKQQATRGDAPTTGPATTQANTIRTSGGIIGDQIVPLSEINTINPPAPAAPKWTGAVKASAEMTRGNTYTNSFDLAFDAVRRGEKDRRIVGAGYAYGSNEEGDGRTVTEDEWFALGKYDYFLNEKLYLFGMMRAEKDRVANLELRLAPSVGVGYQFVERPDFNIHGELGAGWLYEEYEGVDESEDHFVARGAYHIDKSIKDGKIKFFHDLEYLPSLERADDFNVNASAGVRFVVTTHFFTEFSVEWQYDATPAPDAGKNDTKYKAAVGWSF